MTRTPAVMSRRRFASGIFDAHTTSPSDYWLRVHRRAMACRFEVTLSGGHAAWVPAARAALDDVDAIESRLSVFRDDSAVVALNRAAAACAVPVDADLFALVQRCARLHHDTDGAFDVTSTPLSRCWGFIRREGRLPLPGEIAAAMSVVGMHHIVADPVARTVRFGRGGVELNFGAIGKGWALDRMAEGLQAAGVDDALLSAGRSSIRAIGGPWSIGLTSPRLDRPLARVGLRGGALGTSGAGVQFFEVDGKRFGHVIDPRTGWPAGATLSVSVIADDAASADALSTAFFVGGVELARSYCGTHDDVLAVLTPDDETRWPIVIGRYPGADVEVATC
jgi:thiamine biosynthesis lipoprotein